MKKNLERFIGLTRRGVGAVVLALCAFAPASRGDLVIVDNTGNTPAHHTTASGGLVQDFTPTADGLISSVSLSLYSTVGGTMEVFLYSGTPSGTSPGTTLVGDLGQLTVGTSGYQLLSLTGLSSDNLNLVSGTIYGIQITGTTSIGLSYLNGAGGDNAGGTSGSFTGSGWADTGSGYVQFTGNHYGIMSVSEVPEVPMTGMVMGIGVLAIAAGTTLRRKLAAAKSA